MSDQPYAEPKAGTSSGNPDAADREQARLHELRHDAGGAPLPDGLAAVRDRILERFPDATALTFRSELTITTTADRIVDLLTFCRDDRLLACELLVDLSGVHWPGGVRVESPQETTGWPSYTSGDEQGRVEVDYLLRSLRHGHRFRLRVDLADADLRMPSAVEVYASANVMEREVYDFFGVVFEGHPDLTRILMPEDWQGHPLRKDYPLGGVETQYKGATVPPPDERSY